MKTFIASDSDKDRYVQFISVWKRDTVQEFYTERSIVFNI